MAEKSRKPGGCKHYVKRRRRYCASLAAAGCDGFCSLHSPSGLGPDSYRCSRGHGADDTDSPPAGIVPVLVSNAAAASGGRKKNIKRRMKSMTNPDSVQVPVPPPEWGDIFGDESLPLFMDVGCAKGRFLQRLATAECQRFEADYKKHNLLGIEIYEPLVKMANRWTKSAEATRADKLPVDNLFFLACNANTSFPHWPKPLSNLKAVTILFPDPWSRAKHAKRRVVTPGSVNMFAELIPSGGTVYCASDVKPLAVEMQSLFVASSFFEIHEASYKRFGETDETRARLQHPKDHGTDDKLTSGSSSQDEAEFNHVFPAHRYEWEAPNNDEHSFMLCGDEGVMGKCREKRVRWLAKNPYGVPTERDLVCEAKWRTVYRFMVVRL